VSLRCTDLRRVCPAPAAQVVLAALISLDAGPVRLRWLWGAFLVSIITGKTVWVSACTNNKHDGARACSAASTSLPVRADVRVTMCEPTAMRQEVERHLYRSKQCPTSLLHVSWYPIKANNS
jgi:hypothetical protein